LGLDNTWIIKPANLARSIDTWVVNNVQQVIRLAETGPKIAQKYIERPITYLIKGTPRKIDLRYVVIMRSVKPLELYVKDEFYIRFANNPYTMDECTFNEYTTHLTVNNYGHEMINVRAEPFMEEFDQ